MRCIYYCCLKIFERKDLKLIQERSCEITCNHGTFLPKYLPGSCAKTLVYRRTITVTRWVENAISVPLNCHIEWIAWLFMLSTPMRNVLLHGMSCNGAYAVTFLAGMQIDWKKIIYVRKELSNTAAVSLFWKTTIAVLTSWADFVRVSPPRFLAAIFFRVTQGFFSAFLFFS